MVTYIQEVVPALSSQTLYGTAPPLLETFLVYFSVAIDLQSNNSPQDE